MRILFILFASILFNFAYAQTSMTNLTRGNSFNPSMGLNAMMLAADSTVDTEEDGFSLQGVELQFNSDVDAYFRAQVVIGIHKEEHDEEEEEEEEGHAEFAIHPEEVFVETISIPGITIKAGKFLSQFGKYNSLHLHAQPFIYRSVVQEAMFGHEGFASTGASVSGLMPLGWYSELSLEALAPSNEDLFEPTGNATAYVAKLKNLWDLSESTTLEWGLSALDFERAAYNDNIAEETRLTGTDLTIKWRPLKNSRAQSFTWSTEYIKRKRNGSIESENTGITSFIQSQFATRWVAQYQYEHLTDDLSDSNNITQVHTALVGFIPSEFSALRLQYDHIDAGEEETEKRVSLQLNFSIGAHPAHMY